MYMQSPILVVTLHAALESGSTIPAGWSDARIVLIILLQAPIEKNVIESLASKLQKRYYLVDVNIQPKKTFTW